MSWARSSSALTRLQECSSWRLVCSSAAATVKMHSLSFYMHLPHIWVHQHYRKHIITQDKILQDHVQPCKTTEVSSLFFWGFRNPRGKDWPICTACHSWFMVVEVSAAWVSSLCPVTSLKQPVGQADTVIPFNEAADNGPEAQERHDTNCHVLWLGLGVITSRSMG